MAANAGPDIIEDGIVFYYDTGNTVKSYIGEPTTNQFANSNFTNGTTGWTFGSWDGGRYLYSVENVVGPFGEVVPALKITRTSSDTSYAHFHQGNGGKYSNGNTYTLSAYVKGAGTLGQYNQGGFTPLNYNPGQFITLSSTWQRVDYTLSSQTDSNYPYWAAENITQNIPMYFVFAQSELKTHPTQYTPSSRSVTQGLLDMARNSTVNLTDVSFDSNAQMVFDGTNDYLTVPNNANIVPTNTTSWEFMVKPTGTSGYRAVFQKSNYGNSTGFISLFMNPGSLAFRLNASDVAESTRALDHNFNGNITLNTYSHIVLTYNGSVFTLYINGTATNTGSWSYGLGTNQGDFLIGTFWAGPWAGNLDVVKQYSRVLSASEVLTNYNALKTRFGI